MEPTENRALCVVLRVEVVTRRGGDYYADEWDLARHVTGWIEEALRDRDDLAEVAVATALARPALAALEDPQDPVIFEEIIEPESTSPPETHHHRKGRNPCTERKS